VRFKLSLIDLEVQKWMTGRKATSRRERLNEMTLKRDATV